MKDHRYVVTTFLGEEAKHAGKEAKGCAISTKARLECEGLAGG